MTAEQLLQLKEYIRNGNEIYYNNYKFEISKEEYMKYKEKVKELYKEEVDRVLNM